jgi:hypothetical protein
MGAPGRRRYEQAVGLRRLLAALFLLFASPAAAQPSPVGPQPPCGKAPAPSMAVVGAAPAIQIWHDGELERIGWQPPSCTGWLPSSRSKLLVALAGRFRFEGMIDDLVARKGAISTLRGIKYWSATEAQWRTLVIDAAALSGPDAHSRRADFAPSELLTGSEHLFWEDDSRSGEIVYRMRVLDRSPSSVVIATENLTPVRKLMVTLFAPGALQSVEYIAQVSPGI